MYLVKPKKARSAYIFFCIKKREEVRKSIGDNAINSDVMITLGKLWKTLKTSSNEEDKKFFKSLQEEALKDKKRYAKDVCLLKFDWYFLY